MDAPHKFAAQPGTSPRCDVGLNGRDICAGHSPRNDQVCYPQLCKTVRKRRQPRPLQETARLLKQGILS